MKEDLNEYQTDESGFRARFDVFFKTTFRNAVGDFIKKEILRSRREELYGIICPYERILFFFVGLIFVSSRGVMYEQKR